jgi:uncharacterized RDD family membrane protein YckC
MDDQRRWRRTRRVVATWIDWLLAAAVTVVLGFVFSLLGLYLPLELTFLILAVLHATAMTLAGGQTAGKALLGLQVTGRRPGVVGGIRIFLRETLGKPLSLLVPFVAGGVVFFLLQQRAVLEALTRPVAVVLDLTLTAATVAYLLYVQRRRPLHDRIGGTEVVEAPGDTRLMLGSSVGSVAMLLLLVVPLLLSATRSAALNQTMAVDGGSTPASGDVEPLRDVGELDGNAAAGMAAWLDAHGESPVDYAIRRARQHPLVIFGEEHLQRQSLALLNQMIPVLHAQAGVTVVAMEVYLAEGNEEIAALIEAPEFDGARALDLARQMDSWGVWGWKGYWDVLETAWRTNQGLASGQPKLRVVGIGLPIDAPSAAMVGITDNPGGYHVPVWEKLRAVRMITELPAIGSRQAFMAREVERHVFEAGEKGIVWVGAAHAVTQTPGVGTTRRGKTEMGYILAQRHPGEVFQVMLHRRLSSTNPAGEPLPGLTEYVERVFAIRGDTPAGFDVTHSPFATLRDGRSLPFREEALGFADYTQGYLYLGRVAALDQCEWIPGFVTQRAFTANRPFYRSIGTHYGREIRGPADLDRLFADFDG